MSGQRNKIPHAAQPIIIIIGKNSHNIEQRPCAKLLIFNISLVPLDEFTFTEHFFKQNLMCYYGLPN